MTLEQLAEVIQSTPATISRIERGVQPYSQVLLENMANALDCTPADLIMPWGPSPEVAEAMQMLRGMAPDKKKQAIAMLRALKEVA